MIHIQHQKAIGALKNSTKQMNEYNLLLQDQMFKNSVYSHALYMFAVHLKTKKVIISQFKGQYQSYIDYDYEKDFGGVMYLFLRGLQKGTDSISTGIYQIKPKFELVERLDKLFEAEE